MSQFYDEDQSLEELRINYQKLINSGTCWHLEGHVGRTAMRLIEDGQCCLGPEGYDDAYGNRVPARGDVKSGTRGSIEFLKAEARDALMKAGLI